MFTEAKLFQILDSAVKDISHRVAKTDVVNVPDVNQISAANPCSIFTKTTGDYKLMVVLCADYDVLKEMTRNMKHGMEASEEDVSVYMREFFNIFCGHVVSAMNQCQHLKAYFDVPSFIFGTNEVLSDAKLKFHGRYYYKSEYGSLALEALYN